MLAACLLLLLLPQIVADSILGFGGLTPARCGLVCFCYIGKFRLLESWT